MLVAHVSKPRGIAGREIVKARESKIAKEKKLLDLTE